MSGEKLTDAFMIVRLCECMGMQMRWLMHLYSLHIPRIGPVGRVCVCVVCVCVVCEYEPMSSSSLRGLSLPTEVHRYEWCMCASTSMYTYAHLASCILFSVYTVLCVCLECMCAYAYNHFRYLFWDRACNRIQSQSSAEFTPSAHIIDSNHHTLHIFTFKTSHGNPTVTLIPLGYVTPRYLRQFHPSFVPQQPAQSTFGAALRVLHVWDVTRSG